jgi:hypothetical protein
MPVPSARVTQNQQVLGILWCVFGAYRLLTGIIAAFVLRSFATSGLFGQVPEFVMHSMRSLAPMIVLLTSVMAIAAIAAGYGLLTRKPWGRVLALVMGILSLIKLPFGTALGIYTLWVLAPQASGLEWDTLTRAEA